MLICTQIPAPCFLPMSPTRHATRRWILLVAKFALAALILGYLLDQVRQHEGMARLVDEPKDWTLLATGFACTFAAIALSFVRWHALVRALGIDFRLSDAMRLGSLGFMLNFVTLGTIGGDLFKAVFLARDRPGRRTEAIATVVADRLLGLLTMLVLASVGILAADLIEISPPALAWLCKTILLATVIGLVATGLVLFVPGLSGERLCHRAEAVPLAGTTIARLVRAVRAYRNQKRMLLVAGTLCLVVDLLFILSFYLVARGLPVHEPPLAEHLVIVPVANMAGAIPATPSGLGTMEAAAELLYRTMPGGKQVLPGDGTMVTLAHRLTMIAVALVGMVYYLTHRTELGRVLAEAEEASDVN
jgi:uncharacterized protein (TIRG00374 family)